MQPGSVSARYDPADELIDARWMAVHLAFECVGSFVFIFAGTMLCAQGSGSYGQAIMFSGVFTALRYYRRSVNLSPNITASPQAHRCKRNP
jgi:hypothetical protein